MRFSKRSALPATLVALTLALAGCGGGDDDKPKSDDSPSASATPDKPAVWPLTGLPAPEGQSTALDYPPLVAKIPNNEHAEPQAGLSKADLVVEELVEGGTTRLAAFYYSQLPKSEVGPIRSMRASDIGIVSPVGGVMVTSGAAGETIARLNKAGVKFVQEGRAKGFRRDSSREDVYSVMANLPTIAKEYGDEQEEAPAPYFTFGTEQDLPQGQPASTLSAHFGSRTSSWAFRGGKYVNTNGFAPKNDQFPADSVLVLRVNVVDAGYRDTANNFVPESKFVGKGNAQLFHGGQVIDGTWSKAKEDSPLKLSTADGKELKMPAGKTWVELVPVNGKGGSVTFGK